MNDETHRGSGSERGVAMVVMLMIVGLLIALATSLAVIARSDTMIENARSQTLRNFYLAEGGVNRGIAEFKNIFVGFNVPTASDFDVKSMNLGGNTVTYQLALVPSYPKFVRIPAGQPYAGLNSIDYLYTNTAQTLGSDGSTQAQVGAQSLIHNIPLFQFIAFYNNTLEIMPGPRMNLHGRIHSNDNLYLNAGDQLTVTDQPPSANPRLITTVEVTASGDIYRGRLDSNSCSADGSVVIDTLATDPATNDLTPRALDCNGGIPFTSADVAPWLGALAVRVPQISVPPPSATARGSNGPSDYWPKADLRIVLDLTRAMQLESSAPWTTQPCQGQGSTTPCLAVIEAQNADGSRNAAKSSALWQFMSQNPGKIFYNDVPNVDLTTCYSSCAANPANYNPPFRDTDSYTSNRDDSTMVYREADDGWLSGKWTAGANGLDYRRGAFFNNREKRGGQGTFLYLLDIDAQALLQWNIDNGGPLFPPGDRSDGGIVIFASVIGPGTNPIPSPPQPTRYGVRVFDSAVLPFPAGFTNSADPTGLTVVSDQAIFVEGNYNVNGPAANPTWNPAAFIGDAMNVLSQNWETNNNDAKSLLPLGNRPASNTEINAAFIGGVDTTVPGNYNGGFENYPRFQEDWSAATLSYRGSFVSLGNPTFSNGPWCGTGGSCDIGTGSCRGGTSGANDGHCNVYNPPARQWDYDGRFETAENLPPLNPRVVFAQQQLFDEQFR